MEEKKDLFNIQANVKDNGGDILVRQMKDDEMPDDGTTYYCEESGQIYKEQELNFMNDYIKELLRQERQRTLEEVKNKYTDMMISPSKAFLNYFELELSKLTTK